MSKSLIGGGGRSAISSNYKLALLKNNVLSIVQRVSLDPRIDLNTIIVESNKLDEEIKNTTSNDISDSISLISENVESISGILDQIEISLNDVSMGPLITIAESINGEVISISNELYVIETSLNYVSMGPLLTIAESISGEVISISNELYVIETSLNDVSMGPLLTIAEYISGEVISISNELHVIETSLNDVSMGPLLTIAESISGSVVSISYEIFILQKQFEFIYLETSNNTFWNYPELSYSIIQDNLNSIDVSLNSIYDSSLISTINSYDTILEQLSFDSIDIS